MRILLFIISLFLQQLLWSHTAGHEHDQEREWMIQTLFALSWSHTTGVQSAAILTATMPSALLLWADGAAIIVDAKELVSAGLDLSKRSPKGMLFDAASKQLIITHSDLRTITQDFRYKEAVLADFMLNHSQKMNYDSTLGFITIQVGEAKVSWLIKPDNLDDHDHHDHHDHDHHHDEELVITEDTQHRDFLLGRKFWSSREPLLPNQRQRLGQSHSTLRLRMIINAKPLIRAGLNPHKLNNIQYVVEHYGWFNLFKREYLVINFYL